MGNSKTKNRNSSIGAFNQLKESNNKKKKVIWGLSVVALLSVLSTTGLLIFNNSGVSASAPTEETQRIEDLEQSNSELSQLIEKMETNKKELESQILSLSNDKTSLGNEINTLKGTITANQANINSLTNQVASLDNQITSVRQEKLALENQIVELESQSIVDQESITQLRTQLSSKDDELESLNIQKDSLNQTILSKNTEINNLQVALKSLHDQVNVLESQIVELSKGQYTLSVENTELKMTQLEFNLDSDEFTDVTSLDGEGNPVEYRTVVVEGYWGQDKRDYTFYYFNGTTENGAYGTRHVEVSFANALATIKGQTIDEYDLSIEENRTLSYSDFALESLSEKYTEIQDLRVLIQKSTDNMLTEITPESGTFILEDNSYYSLILECSIGNGEKSGYSQTQLMLSTNTTGVYRIHEGENISFNSSGINDNGDFEINFNGNGFENMTLTVTAQALKNIIESDSSWHLQQDTTTFTSDGTEFGTWGAGYGNDNGLKNMNMIINTTNGRMNLCLDVSYMIKEYKKWESNHEQESVGIAVSSMTYFENGKGYTDTPQAGAIYVEGDYIVIEFDAFERVGNKLYILNNGETEGYVELDNGDTTTAVWSVVSNTETEVVISIGYALPGTQVYMTIVQE